MPVPLIPVSYTHLDVYKRQPLGRPWVRMAPPIEVFKNTFADKTNDSRYDGTFTSVYRGNWNLAGITTPTLVNANGLTVKPCLLYTSRCV